MSSRADFNRRSLHDDSFCLLSLLPKSMSGKGVPVDKWPTDPACHLSREDKRPADMPISSL